MPIYFNQDYIQFFKSLSKNNNAAWFAENKKMYEAAVKKPFEAFMSDLLHKASREWPEIIAEPKEAIFRINRDIRFSADKSPYKLHMSAVISAGGRKRLDIPGYYLEINAEHVFLYGGAHQVEKQVLLNLRTHIADHLKDFQKLISSSAFVKCFGEILGEKNKVVPEPFKSLMLQQPLLANKNYYFRAQFPASIILEGDFLPTLMRYMKAAKPLNDFLSEGLGLDD